MENILGQTTTSIASYISTVIAGNSSMAIKENYPQCRWIYIQWQHILETPYLCCLQVDCSIIKLRAELAVYQIWRALYLRHRYAHSNALLAAQIVSCSTL